MEFVFTSKDIHLQRAALDCVISICQQLSVLVCLLILCYSVDISPLVLNGLMEPLLQLLNDAAATAGQDLIHMKVS